jgi:hypothetical protein
MPYQDGTGPEGTGSTGRGLGPCGDGSPRGGRNFGVGRGYGRGRRGRGRGYGVGYGFLTAQEALKAEKNWLENRLNAVNQAIQEQPEA